MARYALTTIDNPHNPITEYDKWMNLMSDYEEEQEIERAIDEAIKLDPFGIYKKVVETSED